MNKKMHASYLNGPMMIEHIIIFFLIRRVRYKTFTYGQFAIAINLWISKIIKTHDKWNVNTWIHSPWTHEHHDTLFTGQFNLYRETLKQQGKP